MLQLAIHESKHSVYFYSIQNVVSEFLTINQSSSLDLVLDLDHKASTFINFKFINFTNLIPPVDLAANAITRPEVRSEKQEYVGSTTALNQSFSRRFS